MSSDANFFPPLFKRKLKKAVAEPSVLPSVSSFSIPLNTYEEESLRPVSSSLRDRYVVFGFSDPSGVMGVLKDYVSMGDVEYGKNYIVFTVEKGNVEDVLKMNRTVVNQEIVGVYKQNIVKQVQNIKKREGGYLSGILEYFFGSV